MLGGHPGRPKLRFRKASTCDKTQSPQSGWPPWATDSHEALRAGTILTQRPSWTSPGAAPQDPLLVPTESILAQEPPSPLENWAP